VNRSIIPFPRVFFVCGVLLFSAACHKKATVQVPVPVAPTPVPAATAPVTRPAPRVTPTPAPAAPTPQPAAPPAAPSKPSPFPPASNSTTAPAPVRPAPVTPVPTPSLGAILTADQRKKLDGTYQSDLQQANTVLNSLKGRTLTPQETDTVNRARAFIRQAAQYHDRDLSTAADLARRARVLTQDLAGSPK
jgi:hypothetical protein